MYSKFSTRNFYISYGYGFTNCGGSSPVTINLNFMDGCLPEEDYEGNISGYTTFKFTATGAEIKRYSDSACTTAPLAGPRSRSINKARSDEHATTRHQSTHPGK